MDLLGEHVDHDVGRSANQDLLLSVLWHSDVDCPREMVDNAGTGNRLACAWRSLDQA